MRSIVLAAEGGYQEFTLNAGEWGGGLQRIDVATGATSSVERRDSAELCAGPLNSDCDPNSNIAFTNRDSDSYFDPNPDADFIPAFGDCN